jgi:lysophospholipase L1-like esterase
MLNKSFLQVTVILFLQLNGILPSSVQAQIDTVRLVCVGNSITEGTAAGDPSIYSYPVQLSKLLGTGWLVKNCGVSGRTMLKHGDFPIWNEQLFKDGLAYNPDIVTIMLGTNDSKSWNWVYKDEFVNDYKAMVDTFRTLPSQPVVWLCLPPPAFSDAFSIDDSIITTDIIPMIQQVALDKECPVIDFYSAMEDYSYLFPDGIHPNAAGLALMAEVFYSTLTAKDIIHIEDVNTAAGRTVSGGSSINPEIYGADNLVDGDDLSVWKTTGLPAQAVVDLDSVQTIDLFQLNFGDASRVGYRFLIETAEVLDSWTTALDYTARTDTAGVILEQTASINARYVRLTVTGASYPKGDTVSVAEFRITKAHEGTHAAVIRAKRISATRTNIRYTFTIVWPTGAHGQVILYRNSSSSGFNTATGYINGSTFSIANEYVRIGNINSYYAVSFLDGIKTTSDTLVIDTTPLAIRDTGSPLIPFDVVLHQAYPNPFNPSTILSFTLPARMPVSLKIYDLLGKEVAALLSGSLPAGLHTVPWNAVNMPSGIYFCRLQAGDKDQTGKIVLMK